MAEEYTERDEGSLPSSDVQRPSVQERVSRFFEALEDPASEELSGLKERWGKVLEVRKEFYEASRRMERDSVAVGRRWIG
jgi:hypothetical protein